MGVAASGRGEATRQFLNQPGVRAVSSTRETINGVPAVVTVFQAQTQQGAVAGYVGHLEYNGRTYQILAYSTPEVFREAQQTFTQIIGSFAPVSDAGILNVQPRRIDIVRLQRSLSLTQFQETYQSATPLNVLAILNQVPEPTATLPAGTLVKRITAEDPSVARR